MATDSSTACSIRFFGYSLCVISRRILDVSLVFYVMLQLAGDHVVPSGRSPLYVTKSSDEGRWPRGSKSVVRDKVLR